MSRVGNLFCTGYKKIIRFLLIVLLFSLLANLYFLYQRQQDVALLKETIKALGLTNIDIQIRQEVINTLLKEVEKRDSIIAKLKSELKEIEQTNKEFDLKKYPRIKAVVTAYTPYRESTGKDENHPLFNVTWSGFSGGGGVCAADPRYWPMGTVLYIEGLGACVVLDTGGAIKGKNRFDYYIPGDEKSAVSAALKWGKRTTEVIVLYRPKTHLTKSKVKN